MNQKRMTPLLSQAMQSLGEVGVYFIKETKNDSFIIIIMDSKIKQKLINRIL